jgi:YidC/Oxa1 family membrane protein insertase
MEKKDISMEARLLIAFLLMGVVLMAWQYLYKPVPEPPATAKTEVKNATGQTVTPEKQAKSAQQTKSAPPPAPAPGQVQAQEEETVTIDTDVYRVVFSNRGGVVRSWQLKTFKDKEKDGKWVDLVYPKALTKVSPPFSIAFKAQEPEVDLNTQLYKLDRDPTGLNLTFEYSNGRIAAKKTFQFQPKGYLVAISSEVSQNGVRIPHALAWRGGFGDSTVANPAAESHSVFYDLSAAKLTQNAVAAAKNGPVSTSGQYSFAGLDDHYFAGVFLPKTGSGVELTTYSDTVPNAAGADEQRVGASVGGEGLNLFTFFAGPKDSALLKMVDPKLEQLIDWGTWFGFIAKPLFIVLTWANDHITHNYGWAIVLVTIAINIVLFPLRLTSMKSSKKMQALQPQIAALNEKYKGLPLKDPRKAEQNQELMELYKKNGVNPVGGCLPMLLQLPILIAFYTVLSVAIQMRGANWLWVKDLSQHEPFYILVVLLVVTQFLQQKMTPSPGMDPAQQKMMMFMPLLFGYMFYLQPAGLVLYWLTGNLVAIAQQLLMNRILPAPPASAVVIPAGKKKR